MRKLLLSLAIALSGSMAAQQHFCHTTQMRNKWFAEHPELKANYDRLQQEAAERNRNTPAIATNNAQQRTSSVSNYTIPVVFHILHTGGSENISDAQVKDAMSILTRDYNALNPDTADVVAEFQNLIGNTKFEFQLATRDPQGNCTNGIIRHWDANTDWTGGFGDYNYTWNPTRYMNVYVVKTMQSGAAGYTFLPGSGVPASADAIVILSNYVGSIGSGMTFRSRALTHEVGHWFNLEHTWGNTNDPGQACGDDDVTDTPITKGFSSCNLSNAKICNPLITENMQNYMDYAYCSRMFTKKQSERMNDAILSPTNGRNNLFTTANLSSTGVTNPGINCVTFLNVGIGPTYTTCTGKPFTVTSYTSNTNPTSILWASSTDASIANPAAAATSISFSTPGVKTITCTVASPGGNINATAVVHVLDGTPQITASAVESFENHVVPANWKVFSPTLGTEAWEISPDGASDGAYSAMIRGEDFLPENIAILESPSYDFKNNTNALFSFKYAYAKHSVSNKDVFKVQASKNCGGSWIDVFAPTNGVMATGSGGVDASTFMPLWEQFKYQELTAAPIFNQFRTEQNVTIRFYFQEDVGGTGHGNRLYLDEINFTTPVGMNELTKHVGLNVYPNPATSAFYVALNLSDASKLSYEVVSVTGAVLIAEAEKTLSTGPHEIMINNSGKLSAGIYFVNLQLNGVKMSRKIVIN